MLTHFLALGAILICGGIIVQIWAKAAKRISDRPEPPTFDEADIYQPKKNKHENTNLN